MKISKQIIALSLATCLTVSPLMVSANNEKDLMKIVPISAEVINEEQEKLVAEYIEYTGKIFEITEKEDLISILVKDNEEEFNGEVLHINKDVIILNSKTKENMKMEELKEGMEITRYAHKLTPVLLSLPGQLTPNVIIVNEEDTGSINVSKFNEELVNVENTLKLLVEDETIIVNEAGEEVGKEDLINRDLIVFYSVATKSIPAQAPAQKIILMNEEEELVEETEEEVEEESKEIIVLDKVVINEEEITLENEMYNKDGVTMIPLRQIAEALGYEVTWNNESRVAELTKDAQWTAVTIGEDNYNFAKMLVKLGVAPELKDSTTFVPFNFLEEVLQVNLEVTESGIMNITK